MEQENTISVLKSTQKNNIVHKVQKGDTPESIAKLYTTTVPIIFGVNGIKSVEEGDRVFIPHENSALYIVKPLDTLISIAKKFNVTTQHIKEQNQNTDNLFIGQMLVL